MITTADNVKLNEGDEAFNYYDMKKGVIEMIEKHAQPDTSIGQSCATPVKEWSNYWFRFRHNDGSSCSLDGSRICSIKFAKMRGWISDRC